MALFYVMRVLYFTSSTNKKIEKTSQGPFSRSQGHYESQPHLQNWPLNQNHTIGFKGEKLATNPAPCRRIFQDWSKHKNLCEWIMLRLEVNHVLRATCCLFALFFSLRQRCKVWQPGAVVHNLVHNLSHFHIKQGIFQINFQIILKFFFIF